MNIQTISYFIGGAFLVAGLLMMGGRVREILPAKLRLSRPAAMGLLLAAIAMWIYNTQLLSKAEAWLSPPADSPAPAAAVDARAKQPAPAPLVVKHAGRISAEFDTPAKYLTPPAPITNATPALPEPPTLDQIPAEAASPVASEKPKRSIGKFFHIGRKKPAEE